MTGLVTAWAAYVLRDDPTTGLLSGDLELSRWMRPIAAWGAVDAWLAAWDIRPPADVRWERSGRWRFLRSADGVTPWRFARRGLPGLWVCVVAARDVQPDAISDWAQQTTPDSTKAATTEAPVAAAHDNALEGARIMSDNPQLTGEAQAGDPVEGLRLMTTLITHNPELLPQGGELLDLYFPMGCADALASVLGRPSQVDRRTSIAWLTWRVAGIKVRTSVFTSEWEEVVTEIRSWNGVEVPVTETVLPARFRPAAIETELVAGVRS